MQLCICVVILYRFVKVCDWESGRTYVISRIINMSDHIISIDNTSESVDTGGWDDVKCLAQTCKKQQPSGGDVENTDEKKGGSNGPYDLRYRKRRKTRRGKSKRRKLKPYSKLSWQEGSEQEDNQTKLANKVRARMLAHRQPVAPYNTTQFLMEDHNDLQDLDVQLKAVTDSDRLRTNASVFQRPSRVRDSSLSVDSEEDYYSSPEDEEEFLTKEFSNAYEDLHAERLHQLTKSQLIQEYLQLEGKVDMLEGRLKKSQAVEIREQMNDIDTDIEKREMHVDEETSRKIQVFQQEINKLLKENEQLRLENDYLRRSYVKGDIVPSVLSSVDSESDSTCSSASNLSDDSLGRETCAASECVNKNILSRTCDTDSAEVE